MSYFLYLKEMLFLMAPDSSSPAPAPSGPNQQFINWLLLAVLVVCVGMVAVMALQGNMKAAQGEQTAYLPCEDGPCMSFIAFGDNGSGDENQMAVAHQMGLQYAKRPFQYALMLGGNFEGGSGPARDGDTRFTQPYQALLDKHVRFVTALGSDDDASPKKQQAEIQFFHMPGPYYSVPAGDADFFVIDGNTFSKDTAQQQWLDQALSKSTAPWKIVIGHQPPFSSGAHGDDPGVNQLRSTLVPMLIQHNVDLYLSASDHDYERFLPIAGVTYVVSGGGGAPLGDFGRIRANSLLRVKRWHFVRFDLDAQHLRFEAIDENGHVFDIGHLDKAADGTMSVKSSKGVS